MNGREYATLYEAFDSAVEQLTKDLQKIASQEQGVELKVSGPRQADEKYPLHVCFNVASNDGERSIDVEISIPEATYNAHGQMCIKVGVKPESYKGPLSTEGVTEIADRHVDGVESRHALIIDGEKKELPLDKLPVVVTAKAGFASRILSFDQPF